ncbi:MAG: hypothetical protein QCI00_07825 [Candidatus Thermoplasmatota archaeon]|nr:hypothetical protein [Candidatus Thermoplasmatota archaeon]
MSSEDNEDIGKRFMDEICQMEKKAYQIKDPEKRKECLCIVKELKELWNE